MFILTGVTPLSLDSNSTPVNTESKKDLAEHKIMALESLLTDLILNPSLSQIDYDPNTPGTQVQLPSFFNEDGSNEPFLITADANIIRQMLYEERTNLDPHGEDSTNDATPRLQEIQLKISEAKNRIITLVTLLQEMQLNPESNIFLGQIDQDFNLPGTQVNIDGTLQITAEANQVLQALYMARAYLGELETSKEFWKEEKKGNITDPSSPENIANLRLEILKLLYKDYIEDPNANTYLGQMDQDPNLYGIQVNIDRTLQITVGANEIQQAIRDAKELLILSKHPPKQSKPFVAGGWFAVVFLRAILRGRIDLDNYGKALGLSKEAIEAWKKSLDANNDGKLDYDDVKTLKRRLLPPVIADKIPEPGRQYNAINKKHDDAVNQYKYKEQNT